MIYIYINKNVRSVLIFLFMSNAPMFHFMAKTPERTIFQPSNYKRMQDKDQIIGLGLNL